MATEEQRREQRHDSFFNVGAKFRSVRSSVGEYLQVLYDLSVDVFVEIKGHESKGYGELSLKELHEEMKKYDDIINELNQRLGQAVR